MRRRQDSNFIGKDIRKVAVLLVGSLQYQMRYNKEQMLLTTADLKYHQFYESENQIILT
jgi:hypothetical protein